MQYNQKIYKALDTLMWGRSTQIKGNDIMFDLAKTKDKQIITLTTNQETGCVITYNLVEDIILELNVQDTKTKNAVNTILSYYESAYYIKRSAQEKGSYVIGNLYLSGLPEYKQLKSKQLQDISNSIKHAKEMPEQGVPYSTIDFIYYSNNCLILMDLHTNENIYSFRPEGECLIGILTNRQERIIRLIQQIGWENL